ncbi:hypothetical protein KY290_032687 [Solanum tuberosum]|uniref:Mariner transposase n=1 Tax=Solanum tuberosum TaxID=4113 RepID=A0ABQ7UEF1_SOLTU|nr:hypothetical protein KY290_032687 [Solanum tuberosum]
MFMATVALKEPTKRNNKNRIVGTIETKSILSVTKDITRSCLIEKVLPAIRSKWPASTSSAPIFIQQDNARPHIGCCMNEVMKDSGGNNYKVPHMNKERLERENDLPLQVRCDVDAVNQALTLLQH